VGKCAVAERDPTLERVVADRYQLGALLGQGGMGRVRKPATASAVARLR
jgi:hypothetical protein